MKAELERGKQSKVLDVDAGLLLLRYATADDDKRPPKIRILVNPKHRNNIELVLNPDHQDAVLWQPGSCLVVRATAPGQLFVEVTAIEDGGSTAASLKIETLSQGKAAVPARQPAVARSAGHVGVDPRRLAVRGHVAGIGDVTVRADEWIAGPVAPARVEGISIDWPGKPDDIDIRYSVRLARPHAVSGQVMQLGDYAGTRGRALPIVGLTLELTGAGASGFRLTAEAVFLGAPVQRMSGAQVEMSGPTRREPLVGFRLRLDEVHAPLAPVRAPAIKTKASGRVRVFRSPAAQGLLQ
ncbi:MAG: hypothetical protein ACLP8B_24445 [Xanthobacteraceae bacterium]